MAQIGSLVASSNQTFNLDFLPSVLVIGNINTDIPISNLSVVTGGEQLISITSAIRIRAFAKLGNGGMLGASVKVPMGIALAAGRVNRQTTINATNGAATTPAVFAASTQKSNVVRRAAETSINASANGSFQNFEAMYFDATNVLRAQIQFQDGYGDEFSVPELDALFARSNITDADGKLEGLTCIEGEGIATVTLYNGSSGQTVVLVSSLYQF